MLVHGYYVYTEGCVFEDNSQIELTAVQKLEKSIIAECDVEPEESKLDKDIQLQDDGEEKLEKANKENDAGEEKALVKEKHDDEKSITEEDGADVVAAEQLQDGVATTIEPISLPCTTK